MKTIVSAVTTNEAAKRVIVLYHHRGFGVSCWACANIEDAVRVAVECMLDNLYEINERELRKEIVAAVCERKYDDALASYCAAMNDDEEFEFVETADTDAPTDDDLKARAEKIGADTKSAEIGAEDSGEKGVES